MSDNDHLYVKKKHFYSAIVAALILFLYVINIKTVSDSNISNFVMSFLILGYIFYFSFLQTKLKNYQLTQEDDEAKEDSKP
jgi:hypothetical protein